MVRGEFDVASSLKRMNKCVFTSSVCMYVCMHVCMTVCLCMGVFPVVAVLFACDALWYFMDIFMTDACLVKR